MTSESRDLPEVKELAVCPFQEAGSSQRALQGQVLVPEWKKTSPARRSEYLEQREGGGHEAGDDCVGLGPGCGARVSWGGGAGSEAPAALLGRLTLLKCHPVKLPHPQTRPAPFSICKAITFKSEKKTNFN